MAISGIDAPKYARPKGQRAPRGLADIGAMFPRMKQASIKSPLKTKPIKKQTAPGVLPTPKFSKRTKF